MRFSFLSRVPSHFLTALLLLAAIAGPASAASSEELELLKQQLKVLQERIEALENQEKSKADKKSVTSWIAITYQDWSIYHLKIYCVGDLSANATAVN